MLTIKKSRDIPVSREVAIGSAKLIKIGRKELKIGRKKVENDKFFSEEDLCVESKDFACAK